MLAMVSVLAALATVSGASTPDVPLHDAIHDMVAAGFPAAVAYTRTGPDSSHEAAGFADLDTGEKATPAHRFRIASNTKAFTATVVLQLVGEGRLALDTPVEHWLPGLVGGRPITVRQLLNHTSGLYDPTDDPEFWAPVLTDPTHVYRPREIVATAAAHPLAAPPGARHTYSNTNYLVAGLLIEKVTGRSAVLQVYQRILVPLHLVNTSFPLSDPRIHGRHLHGYDLKRKDVTVFSPSYDWTAGALISTVDDLARFHRALFDGTLLPPALLAELKKTVPVDELTDYGLGVERRTVPCQDGTTRSIWGNTGGGPGYHSYSLITEDADRQLVLALNLYDIRADLADESPVPPANLLPALTATFC
ncbi:serine hydrolase domain-containing protein [Actinophytocola sediminis]